MQNPEGLFFSGIREGGVAGVYFVAMQTSRTESQLLRDLQLVFHSPKGEEERKNTQFREHGWPRLSRLPAEII